MLNKVESATKVEINGISLTLSGDQRDNKLKISYQISNSGFRSGETVLVRI
jgi:hypothetical protein